MHTRFKQFIYTQAKDYDSFAEIVEWDIQKVKNVACGKQKVNIHIAKELEEKFNLNPCWLCFGRGEMYEAKLPLGEDLKSEDETNKDIENLKKELQEIKDLIKNN